MDKSNRCVMDNDPDEPDDPNEAFDSHIISHE